MCYSANITAFKSMWRGRDGGILVMATALRTVFLVFLSKQRWLIYIIISTYHKALTNQNTRNQPQSCSWHTSVQNFKCYNNSLLIASNSKITYIFQIHHIFLYYIQIYLNKSSALLTPNRPMAGKVSLEVLVTMCPYSHMKQKHAYGPKKILLKLYQLRQIFKHKRKIQRGRIRNEDQT
jgi:hypothetical protein